jgi:tRNA pseudouridine38-40 synthase
MRYFITFAYRGTDFHGSQTQPNGNTVQAEMEAAFATILRQAVPLTFAGRTDAGVHAEKMIAHFDIDQLPITIDHLQNRLNGLLPDSIAIIDLYRVTDEAHARFDATARTYRYRITTRKDPFLYINHTRVAPGLDFEAMNKAAQLLLGKQDFASFCRVHTDVKTTICDVKEARWVQENETEAYFVITADRFLRNMVRAVVGTLFDIGRGKTTEAHLAEILAAHDRCKAGHSAPAEGLSLVEIIYPKNIYL